MPTLQFLVDGIERSVSINALVIAGWTGRDKEALEHHIAELAEIGVKRPRTTPCFYRVGSNLLTTAKAIEVAGSDSSGEVEFVLVSQEDGLYVGVGADHTDRKVEAYGVTVSKQVCPKPISRELWRLSDVQGHWDELILRSWVSNNGTRRLYQEGSVRSMLAPLDLIRLFTGGAPILPVGTAMYCGTLAVIGKISGGDVFEGELYDPRQKRTIHHTYSVRSLNMVD